MTSQSNSDIVRHCRNVARSGDAPTIKGERRRARGGFGGVAANNGALEEAGLPEIYALALGSPFIWAE
jgi:hypothetical protein